MCSAPQPPQIPPHLASQLQVKQCEHGHITWEMPGELAPLLGWLATLPLKHIRIEPIGLRAIYDRFHSEPSRVETPPDVAAPASRRENLEVSV